MDTIDIVDVVDILDNIDIVDIAEIIDIVEAIKSIWKRSTDNLGILLDSEVIYAGHGSKRCSCI